MWKRTTREKYWYGLEVLPPAYQDGHGFLVEEPVTHRECNVMKTTLPTYEAFIERKGRYYVSVSAITIPEYKQATKS